MKRNICLLSVGILLLGGSVVGACGDDEASSQGTGGSGAAGGSGGSTAVGGGGGNTTTVPADYAAACAADATAQCAQYFICFPDTGPYPWASVGQREDTLCFGNIGKSIGDNAGCE